MRRAVVVGGMVFFVMLFEGLGSARGAEPKVVTLSELSVTPGDPALAKELAAKFSTRAGVLADITAVPAGPAGATPAAAPCRPPLTVESLKQMLENLGYSPQLVKLPTGETTFSVVVPRGTWTMRFIMALTADGKMLSVVYYLGKPLDANKVEASRWQKLMESNVNVAPFVFAYSPPNKYLVLYLVDRNIDISPAQLRQWLDRSMDVVIATSDQWQNLDSPAAAAPAK